jgi:cell division septal protein FtsQ
MRRGGGASRKRFRLLPTVLLTAAILGLPAVVYGWGRSSSSFTVDKVIVTGAELVPQRRLERLLRREYVGRNLFAITAKDVMGTLAPLCYVATANVDRDFPDTLRVAVAEHHPVAYVLAGGRWYVIADDAHVICALEPPAPGSGAAEAGNDAAPRDLPVDGAATPSGKAARELALLEAGPPGAKLALPRLAANGTLKAGETLGDTDASTALPVIARLSPGLRTRLDVVVVAAGGDVSLRFAGGLTVQWGDAQRTLAKRLALEAVLKRYEDKGTACTFMDVSIPDRVLARPVLK